MTIKARRPFGQVLFIAACGMLLPLLAGCGDDKPYSGPDPNASTPTYSAPAPGILTHTSVDPAPPPPDPLLASGNTISTIGAMPTDDPLLHTDPLIRDDSLKGHVMPTEHSHWLRGEVRDARLTVLLNGIRQGVYTGLVDQDITMRLRSGVNQVTFLYAPQQADASAQMDVYESEHDPPIPPLVTYQSGPQPEDATSLPVMTQSYTFVAK